MSQQPTDVFRTSCGATAPLELKVSGPGWEGGARRVFEHPFVLVGRHERSCLRLEDGEVSRRHAYLQQLGGRVFCVDLGSRTGIRWGGEPRSAGWLRPEQGVQIGPFTLELAMAARIGEDAGDRVAEDWDPLQDRANDPGVLPRITVEVGNEELSRLCMNRVLVLVGSSPACRVRLRDARVSRYHCSLVRTPQGVWLIDLLHGTGAFLNGQPFRCAPIKEGDRLQVGPYVLRVWYPDGQTKTPHPSLVGIPAGTPKESEEWGVRSEESIFSPHSSLPTPHSSLRKGGLEPAATEASVLVSALQAELDQDRERQRDVEILRQQLADSQAECDRLGEQALALEVQVAGVADLQARLEAAEASARELDVVRGERDRWLAETQDLQSRLAADSAERQEWQQRLEATQQQLADARAEHARLCARVPELEDRANAADHLWTRLHKAGAETERLRVQLRTAESHETELETVRAECDRLGAQVRALEVQVAEVADLQARLEAAEASARELDVVRGERDRWLAEMQDLQSRLAADSAERQEWQKRLEATQQQLVGEREAVRAAGARLDQESAILQRVQADLAARNAEHGAALQRLQEAQDERALAQDEARSLQAGLDEALECQRDIEVLRQQLADAQAELAQLCARVPELEDRANAADHLWTRLREAGAETERLRVQLRAAESQETELETVRAECDRLGAQARALEVQVAEITTLQARLEAAEVSVRELDVVRGERDRWLAEAQKLQSRLAADSAEREEWRQRLEAAQQQLVGEGEALRQQLADARAEHARLCARVPELEDRANSADRLWTRLRKAGAETERLRVQLRAAESHKAELETVRAECDRLGAQARALEVQVAEITTLQARLEAAEVSVRELDVVRGERDRWLAEAQNLQSRLAADSADQEQLGRLAADLHAAQAERDRLQSEQQTSRHSAEQAWARVSDLERALTAAAAAHETALEEARARWESERQALEARLELERQTHEGAVQAAIGDVQARAVAERQEWRQRLEGAEQQLVWERGMFQEQSEQIRQQAARLLAERDRIAARLIQAELCLRVAQEGSPDEASRAAEMQRLRQQAAQDQVFVQLSSMRLGHLLPQTIQAQVPGAPTVQADEGEASASSNTPQGSAAPLEGRQPTEDAHGCLPQQKDDQPEARQRLWRQILGRVLGK